MARASGTNLQLAAVHGFSVFTDGELVSHGLSLLEVESTLACVELATLECLINVPVGVFISRKMPPYAGLIWHYTFIKKIKKHFIFTFHPI